MRKMIPFMLLFASSAALADGATTYTQFCSSCHGAAGAGDGVAAVALTPKPADFTSAEFWSTRSDEDLTKVIKEGGSAVGKSPLMAPFGGQLSDAQIAEVLAHMKTFKK